MLTSNCLYKNFTNESRNSLDFLIDAGSVNHVEYLHELKRIQWQTKRQQRIILRITSLNETGSINQHQEEVSPLFLWRNLPRSHDGLTKSQAHQRHYKNYWRSHKVRWTKVQSLTNRVNRSFALARRQPSKAWQSLPQIIKPTIKTTTMNLSNAVGYGNGSVCTILDDQTLKRYRTNQGYIYLVHAQSTNRYKIGRSVNPIARLEQLKGQSPYPLQIVECFWTPDAIADEKYLHESLASIRVHGEWFEFSVLTEDELEQLNTVFPEELQEKYDASLEGIGFYYFIGHCHVLRQNAKLFSEAIYQSIIQSINYPECFVRLWVEDSIYRSFYECQDVSQFFVICEFILNDWVECICNSIQGARIEEGKVGYFEAFSAINASIAGFTYSLKRGVK